jgi:hypothetical protein
MTDGRINNLAPPGTGWMFSPPGTPDTGDLDIVDVSQGATRDVIWAWAPARTSYPDTRDEPWRSQLATRPTEAA